MWDTLGMNSKYTDLLTYLRLGKILGIVKFNIKVWSLSIVKLCTQIEYSEDSLGWPRERY